jgi:hypothetical protein
MMALTTAAADAADATRIEVLSNRADLISGGDALVAVDAPAAATLADLHVRLNGDRDGSVRQDRRGPLGTPRRWRWGSR